MKLLNRTLGLFLAGLAGQLFSVVPAFAQDTSTPGATAPIHIKVDTRPPVGYARPPLYVKPGASSTPPKGAFTPSGIWTFYGIPPNGGTGLTNEGTGITIGIVDAYDDPNAKADLDTFNNVMKLGTMATCGTSGGRPVLSGGCFAKVPGSGTKFPKADQGWALEISLDVQWAHAVAPKANILLVEAASNRFTDLMAAVDKAVSLGASVVSMSWGGSEFSSESNYDSHFCGKTGVVFFASSGDSGAGPEYPSASPCVVSVGGTTAVVATGGTYGGETAWSGSGGGASAYETMPISQQNYLSLTHSIWSTGKRATPDVAYVADPNTGFAVYDSYGYQGQAGWFQVGGTSAGSPQWAALFAIADSGRVAGPALTGLSPVYLDAGNNPGDFHDITSGSNGTCVPNCIAQTGYDLVTGIGSPQAGSLTSDLHTLTQ